MAFDVLAAGAAIAGLGVFGTWWLSRSRSSS
jgi:hypothetical protein